MTRTQAKKKRPIDRHQNVLDGIEHFLYHLPIPLPTVVQMHTRSVRYMPKVLAGVPDLIVSTADFTVYCEIKPLYKKSRRDTLREEQAMFALDIYQKVSKHLRYWIVEDSYEFEQCWSHNTHWYAQEYHLNTMSKYAFQYDMELPW